MHLIIGWLKNAGDPNSDEAVKRGNMSESTGAASHSILKA